MSLYLDHNASAPVDARVLAAMNTAYQDVIGNADSRTHDHGASARRAVEKAREQLAVLLGVDKDEVVFTSGATESNNLSVLGLAEYGRETNRRHIITTAIEHKAVLEPIQYLVKHGFEKETINPGESGRINSDELLSKVRPDTLLVSVIHANNETGVIQPVKEIGGALADTSVIFHTDAVQSCGKRIDEIRALRYDLLSLTAHKMGGPQGVGALIARKRNNKKPPVRPIVFGGGHEGGLRAGTLPVALIVGFGKACEIMVDESVERSAGYESNKRRIMAAIRDSGVSYEVNGDPSICLPNTLNLSFLGVDSEALMIATKQFCSISNGSACASNDYSHSHVLSAMGLSTERIESAVRLSWGHEPIEMALIEKLLRVVRAQQ